MSSTATVPRPPGAGQVECAPQITLDECPDDLKSKAPGVAAIEVRRQPLPVVGDHHSDP